MGGVTAACNECERRAVKRVQRSESGGGRGASIDNRDNISKRWTPQPSFFLQRRGKIGPFLCKDPFSVGLNLPAKGVTMNCFSVPVRTDAPIFVP